MEDKFIIKVRKKQFFKNKKNNILVPSINYGVELNHKGNQFHNLVLGKILFHESMGNIKTHKINKTI